MSAGGKEFDSRKSQNQEKEHSQAKNMRKLQKSFEKMVHPLKESLKALKTAFEGSLKKEPIC